MRKKSLSQYYDDISFDTLHEAKDIIEIDREVWEEMSQKEQEDFLDEAAVDFRNNVIDCSAWVIEEDE